MCAFKKSQTCFIKPTVKCMLKMEFGCIPENQLHLGRKLNEEISERSVCVGLCQERKGAWVLSNRTSAEGWHACSQVLWEVGLRTKSWKSTPHGKLRCSSTFPITAQETSSMGLVFHFSSAWKHQRAKPKVLFLTHGRKALSYSSWKNKN